MIANLIMYAIPELADAHNRYWTLIRANLSQANISSPVSLAQDVGEFAAWESSALLLSQTCGMPFRIWLHDRVTLVGTPDYGVQGCQPGYYRSAFVVRAGDERAELSAYENAIFAFNKTYSQSGWAAPYAHLSARGFWFRNRLQVGRHLLAAQAVADGRADIACLDAVSWRLMQEHTPLDQALRVLEWTDPTPGLPYITASHANADAIFDAVGQAISQLAESDRQRLLLNGLVRIPASDYRSVPNPPLDEVFAGRSHQ